METITLDAAPKSKAEYESAVDRLLSEMESMKASFSERQHHAEKVQSETRVMLSRLQETLSRLEAS